MNDDCIAIYVGSPPRMRGKDNVWTEWTTAGRITPAYAGKSADVQRAVRHKQDHPRVCGEKNTKWTRQREHIGSPPRMRGKGHISICVISLVRITPAYAGKSKTFLMNCRSCEDHPRVCGEKLCKRVDR